MSAMMDPALSSPHQSPLSSIHSGEFVMVSKLDQDSPSTSVQRPALAMASKINPSSGASDEDLFQRIGLLTKENEELKGILKHNNSMVQQYFQDLATMQQTQKDSQENLNREHARAKEVVTKLREKNHKLKQEVEQAGTEIKELKEKAATENIAVKVNCEKVEAENRLLQSHIETLQDQIGYFDKHFKECEQFNKTEAAHESWKGIMDSMSSLTIVSKPKPFNEQGGKHLSLEEKFTKLERKKEIMEIEIENLRIEKQAMVDQLQQVSEDYGALLAKVEIDKHKAGKSDQDKQIQELIEQQNKMHVSLSQLREEKQELCRLLTETRESEQTQIAGKKLYEGIIQKLEETIAKLQKEKRETEQLWMKELEELQHTLEAETGVRKELEVERTELMGERERITQELQHLKEEQESAKHASAAVFGDPEGEDSMIKLKQQEWKKDMLSYQKRRNEYEKRFDELLEREKAVNMAEKAIELQKAQIEQKLADTREMMQAELESRAQTYHDQTRNLHSELEEGRAREESLREQVCQLIEDNQHLDGKCNRLEIEKTEREVMFKESFSQIADRSDAQMKQEEEQSQKLKSHLAASEDELQRYKQQYSMLRNEYDILFTQHNQVTSEYDDLMKSFQSTIDANSKKQKSSTTEVSSLRAQLEHQSAAVVAAEEAIQKRDAQLRFLEDRAKELQEQADRLPVLQQQVEVFRTDFAAEREAREKQQGELLNMRERVQQLQEELDAINLGQMVEMQRRHGSYVPVTTAAGYPAGYPATGNPPPGAWQPAGQGGFFRRGGEPESQGPGPEPRRGPEPDEPWICPGCRQILENFDALERHVTECPPARHGNGPPNPGPDHSQPLCPFCSQIFPDHDTLEIHANECADALNM